MITLSTLGALDLRGPSGEELRAVLAQPKRVALLIYLGVAAPRGFHRRDKLVALFWPELDQEHARGALRKAVHGLRRALGSDVLVSRADEELRLSEGSVRLDLLELEAAIAEGRPADALALYRGEFLEGLFVTDAPQFERWLDDERVRVRGLVAQAAWSVADTAAASGRETDAAQWARRAAAFAPDDEAAHRRLITLLYRVGNRAGALKAYDEFVARLAREYGVKPSAQTRALVDDVRMSSDRLKAPQ